MNVDRTLLASLLRENPFQPATSFWRAIELSAVLRHGLPNGRGLDLGCGDGKLMRTLLGAARASPELVGVDIDPHEARDAAETGSYVRVRVAPGDRIPEPDASFDFVFSNSVLEHIDDLEPVITEVARVLRAGGTFLFTVPSAGFHDCLGGPLLPWVGRSAYAAQIDRRCAHIRYWSKPDWEGCMQRHGLGLTHASEYLTAPEVRRWETLARFTSGLLYPLFRSRLRPIEIQRRLGLRRSGMRLPPYLAAVLARIISFGGQPDASGGFGCLLVEARKPGGGDVAA